QGPQADDALRATDDGTSAVRVNAEPAAGTVIVGGVRVDGAAPPPPDDEGRTQVRRPAAVDGTPVRAREGRPGEAPTIVIGGGEPQAGTVAAPAVDATPLSTVEAGADDPAPAANTEATDTRGQTSVDRKNERTTRDRSNEQTATERARRNDRRGNP
ncbi:MAG TPA: hypothetical protein VE871_15800, partial [Longimicrobium sp.]|nr:hypothetical protein [Longimicrobium sp.]